MVLSLSYGLATSGVSLSTELRVSNELLFPSPVSSFRRFLAPFPLPLSASSSSAYFHLPRTCMSRFDNYVSFSLNSCKPSIVFHLCKDLKVSGRKEVYASARLQLDVNVLRCKMLFVLTCQSNANYFACEVSIVFNINLYAPF